ncbi:unnamed protein product, partial [Musa textilis]
MGWGGAAMAYGPIIEGKTCIIADQSGSVLVECSGADGEEKNPDTALQNKKYVLLQLLEELRVPKTIVFCNKLPCFVPQIETCRKVENVLNLFDRKGSQIQVLPFHAAIAQEVLLSNMREFLNTCSKDLMFLICTDRASRGIDFAGVDHVALFDFPCDPSEYGHHVGRTAQGAGGKGKAYVFVVGRQVSLARRILWKGTRKAIHCTIYLARVQRFSLLQTDDPPYLVSRMLTNAPVSCF